MADPENQMIPIIPAGVKSDEQPYTSNTTTTIYTKQKHQETNKSLVYVLACIVFVSTIFLIFASVFLRVDNPRLRLKTVSIQNFQFENTNTTSLLNITMLTQVTVNNRNFGRYVFDNCTAVLLYGNDTIGDGYISGGRVGAKKTKSIDVMMQVGYGNLNFSSDGLRDKEVMEVISYAKMKGRVHVMKIVDTKKTIEMNCTISLNLTSRSFVSSLCS